MRLKKLSAVGLGAVLLSVSSLLSRLLGVLRDAVFAKIFGVGLQGGIFALDTYFAAFRLPDLIYSLLIVGAMSAAFIPIYTRLLNKDREHSTLFVNQVLHGLLYFLLVFSVLAFLFAPYLVRLIAPGFEAENMHTTVNLTRIMLISPIFLGLSSVFQGVENTHKRFLGIALAPIFYNSSIIIAAWFFAPEYGVYALAWGVSIGALLHFAVQMPGAIVSGYKYKFVLNFGGKYLKEFIFLTLPRLFGVAVSQFGIFVDTLIASLLAAGSISVFNYSLNLQSLPYGVVAVSFSMAVFSTLSEKGLKKDKDDFLKLMQSSTETILFWVLPAILGLFLLREPIVNLILTRGAFSEHAAKLTILTFGIFIWASLAQSMIPLFARSFYALHHTKTPVIIGLFAVFVNLCVSLALTQVYHFAVWALAVSALVSTGVNALLLIIFLARFLKVSPFKFFNVMSIFKILISCLVMGVVVYYLSYFDFHNLILELTTSSLLGFGFYMAFAKLMKINPSLREH